MKHDPLFVSEVTAARMLDMDVPAFRALRAAGVLPAPRAIGPHERYDVAELRSVIRGDAAAGGAMQW